MGMNRTTIQLINNKIIVANHERFEITQFINNSFKGFITVETNNGPFTINTIHIVFYF